MFFTTQTTQAINPHVYKSLAYDPVKSFAPVAGITLGAQIVMVREDLPAKTIREFIALAKAQPGKLSFGSGNGSSRGGAELFRIMVGIDLLGVPYKTQPQAIADLLGGRIDIIFSDFTVGLPPALDGRARGLAVAGLQQIEIGRGLRRLSNECVQLVDDRPWRAGGRVERRPGPHLEARNAALVDRRKLLKAGNALLAGDGISFVGSPEELAAFQAVETKKWAEIVSTAGMKEP